MNKRIETIYDALSEQLETTDIDIRDDSHQHIGHEGWKSGLGHYAVTIRSPKFAGVNPVARHKLVYDALGSLMQTDIHALQIRALAPGE